MSEPPRRKVYNFARREVTPAFTLSQIGKYALQKARDTEEGSLLEIITALLMCPLTMEAVLNHAGYKIFVEDAEEPTLWDAVERLGPRNKLEVVSERCGFSPDMGTLPFQDFPVMFRFRDQLAHGKTSCLTVHAVAADSLHAELDLDRVPGLQADWELHCDVSTAERWHSSVREMAQLLCDAAKSPNPVIIGYTTDWSASLVPDENTS